MKGDSYEAGRPMMGNPEVTVPKSEVTTSTKYSHEDLTSLGGSSFGMASSSTQQPPTISKRAGPIDEAMVISFARPRLCDEMRVELRERGLKTSGRKIELARRLLEARLHMKVSD